MSSQGSCWRLRVGGAALWIAACAPAPSPVPPPAPVPPALEPAPVAPPECQHITRIEIHKGERRLLAHCERGARVELRIALGRDPEGPKRLAGDARTPEGSYRISGPPQNSRFHRFLPIDYPSREDAESALAAGRLSPADHRRILEAHARGELPPADTALGGGLGLHGEGERWRGDSPHLDWTYGCIALSDGDIDFLAERAAVGTPVEIDP